MPTSDLDRLLDFPRVDLGLWPTPVSYVQRPGKPGILIKRDDLSGHGRGGVKTRKIEHLVGYMLANGYDEFVTAVGNVTNLVHDIVPVLQRFGIAWQIFINNDPPLPAADRERIFGDLREHVQLLGPARARTAGSMVAASLKSRRRGRRPLLVLPSLMHPAGAVGNARGFIEMMSQVRAEGHELPGTVFITVASGTTLAGFLLAENALRHDGHPPIRIFGVQVYPGQARLWVLGLIRWTERFLGLRQRVPARRIELISSSLHGGFGRYPEELAHLCLDLREEVGINVDPIFGGKTWSAMESHLSSRATEDDSPVLYWHCGYTPNWQALDEVVNRRPARTGGV
ncbi:MAG: pyridoxal-phosphate dependent enzyme [Chloroflexota bacterium]|nr:pyridoxal-phosphate dependent enzyme [Chloroflexota bacterium]